MAMSRSRADGRCRGMRPSQQRVLQGTRAWLRGVRRGNIGLFGFGGLPRVENSSRHTAGVRAGRPITHVLKQFNHRALPNIAMGAQFDRTPGWALRILESLNHFGRFDELSL